ncbi:MAG: hypothetical protein HOV80_31670 [Polyangiaceae bacterium]|nr:hypothetical protein [Polyangiaceae bacterium]
MARDLGLIDVLGAAAAGAGQKRVLVSMNERRDEIFSAFRRAVPFLIRRSIAVTVEPARLSTPSELCDAVGEGSYLVPLATDPGGSRALLLFDPAAVGFLLTGILGGDPDDAESASSLTTPQRAVLGSMADQLIQKLGASFQASGLSFRRLPASATVPNDAQLVTVSILLGDGPTRRVSLAIAREALQSAAVGPGSTAPTPSDAARIPSILGQAELDLVCELGRVKKTVGEIQGLKVGDTLRLDTLVSDTVALHVQGQVIVRGQPTTQGSRIALSVIDAARALRSDAA